MSKDPNDSAIEDRTNAEALHPNPIAWLLLGLLAIYRIAVSPLFGQSCRFEPSCSRYASQAIRRHGVIRGAILAVRRIGRCHPFHNGGYDPVP